jgi:topoisomerase-4 subunit B
MMPAQLRETPMNPARRVLLRVAINDGAIEDGGNGTDKDRTSDLIESLMGRRPELRFAFIQENAKFARDLDV